MINSFSKRDIICLVTIIVLAGIIRFWNLGSLPLADSDEAFHFLSSSAIHEHGIPIMESGLVYTRGLPLLYLQAASTAVFGDNVVSLRLPSVIIGIFTVFITFVFFRSRLPSASLIISLIIAISPLTVYYSRNARMYELLVATSLTLWTTLGVWKRTGNILHLVGVLFLIVFIVPVHYLSIISMLGIVIPSIINNRLSVATRIYLICFQLVSFGAWFGYYKWLIRLIFPTPEHLVFYSKSSMFILPDCTLLQQVFNSSPIISSLVLTLGLLLVGIVTWHYKNAMSVFEKATLYVIICFSFFHFSMVSVCGAIVWGLVNIYRNDEKQWNITVIYLSGFGVAVFTLLWALLAAFYSDMSSLAAVSRCFAYPKIFQSIVIPVVKKGYLLEFLLFGYTIFLLLFYHKKFSKEIHIPSLAGLSIFVLAVFACIGSLNSFYKHVRYFYYIYPIIVGLGIISLQQLKPLFLARFAIGMLILFLAYGSWNIANLSVGDVSPYGRRIVDYDSVARRLAELRKPGDTVISTSSQRTAVFGGKQDGFFPPNLREFEVGHWHYITNAIILRAPEDMINLISERGRIWMLVELTNNLPDWVIKLFSSEKAFEEVFRSSDGRVVLYSATREDIINALFRLNIQAT